MSRAPSLLPAALAAAVLLAAPAAQAFDPAAMSAAERAAFEAAVREYLLANPQVIREALAALEEAGYAEEIAADLARIEAEAAELFDDPRSPVFGNPDGDVTLVLFTDYRCPFCRQAEAELRALAAADPGLRVVLKDYPILGPQSELAAAFALAVRQLGGEAAHAAAHAALFGLRGGITEATLGRLAGDLGLDPSAVIARMQSPEVARALAANLDLGQRFGLDATPSFALADRIVRGHVPAQVLARYVEEVRAKSR